MAVSRLSHTNGRSTPELVDQYGQPFRRDGSSAPAGIALPHDWTFIARMRGGDHTFWHERFDEALKHGREDAHAMRNDCWLMSLIDERKRAVAGLPWHLEVPDEKDKHQLRVKDGLTRLIKGILPLRRIIGWLLEALWFGRYGVQVEWAWTKFNDDPEGGEKPAGPQPPGQPPQPGAPPPPPPPSPSPMRPSNSIKKKDYKGLTIRQAWPVHGDKIGHQEDGTPYVLVDAARIDGLPGVSSDSLITTTVGGRALSLRGSWRERFIFHRHLMEDMDFFQSEAAEAIHGVGIRSKVFWPYWMRMEFLGNVVDFFDRVGLGVTIWKFPRGDERAKQAMMTAAKEQQNRAHIFVPVDPDGNQGAGNEVERMEVPTSGAEALRSLMEYLEKGIERYVVGQEASASGRGSGGLGNEASSEFQRDTKIQIAIEDAWKLAESLTGNDREPAVVNTMLRHTYPWADFPVWWVFDVEKGESEKKLEAASKMTQMGLTLKADEVRAAGGFSKPAEGDEVVGGQQQGPGGPGGPGGPPGAGGEDPLAALMGGGAGGESGGPEEEGAAGDTSGQEDAGAGVGGAPGGDFLDALRHMREGMEALRYDRDWMEDIIRRTVEEAIPKQDAPPVPLLPDVPPEPEPDSEPDTYARIASSHSPYQAARHLRDSLSTESAILFARALSSITVEDTGPLTPGDFPPSTPPLTREDIEDTVDAALARLPLPDVTPVVERIDDMEQQSREAADSLARRMDAIEKIAGAPRVTEIERNEDGKVSRVTNRLED